MSNQFQNKCTLNNYLFVNLVSRLDSIYQHLGIQTGKLGDSILGIVLSLLLNSTTDPFMIPGNGKPIENLDDTVKEMSRKLILENEIFRNDIQRAIRNHILEEVKVKITEFEKKNTTEFEKKLQVNLDKQNDLISATLKSNDFIQRKTFFEEL